MKPFKTITEQTQFLESDKKMIITNNSLLEQTLIDNNYYRFINSAKLRIYVGSMKQVNIITTKNLT